MWTADMQEGKDSLVAATLWKAADAWAPERLRKVADRVKSYSESKVEAGGEGCYNFQPDCRGT